VSAINRWLAGERGPRWVDAAGGQEMFHFRLHVIPRFVGDESLSSPERPSDLRDCWVDLRVGWD
jgi:hypothetical protein